MVVLVVELEAEVDEGGGGVTSDCGAPNENFDEPALVADDELNEESNLIGALALPPPLLPNLIEVLAGGRINVG